MSPSHKNKEFLPQCPEANCPRDSEQEKENFWDAKFLKTALIILALVVPLHTWQINEIYKIETDLATQKEKVNFLLDIRQDINSIKMDISAMKIDIGILKSDKGNH